MKSMSKTEYAIVLVTGILVALIALSAYANGPRPGLTPERWIDEEYGVACYSNTLPAISCVALAYEDDGIEEDSVANH